MLEGSEGTGETLDVAGGGLEEVLEVALGVAPIAMAAQAVGADQFGESGFDASAGLELLPEGRGLGLGTASGEAGVVLGDAEVAAALAVGALGPERASGADGGWEADLERVTAVALAADRPFGGRRTGQIAWRAAWSRVKSAILKPLGEVSASGGPTRSISAAALSARCLPET
ncbi:MAG: hypothetical protein U0893_24125 [Chloroflexota bacterium]